ncbi:ABC transporter ATP-binding protein [Rathayibacter rathayi]|uniref:ABC transporter ATP-binding protein n=1 Tax=Rathayibacter rathayi TaxID=33887 RepID=A0ABX5AD00_RATRA|nr:ABC transporter ATP-binding protein [Rathayibacter rathayi]AZZ48433.1 ABC transporter ATP-binding protein [Rathayibacter rathayi]MWV74343.1 ATP-binding cassette domain-containing protein [Rathayibacter rathayi NCPPB 2980 = VKM Ac-1601]PPF47629.1 ABC transporter ATP-binding protein [Rathayibacter rathayi]PPF78836.1 ABC transporter ATP-binding protein [Rathayibacter rathayi]PPG12007.1 ABC transporter ATP-binding protein [Rathayibacter rathayi]
MIETATKTPTARRSEELIGVHGLTKTLGARTVVDDVSFSLRRGSAFGLLGPNGAGKTTTVRLLTGLLTPTAGSVELFGEALTASSADRLRHRIGVQTDGNLYDLLTVRDNLTAWGELFGMRKAHRNARIDEVLELFGLSDRADDVLGSFSKGMRQKVAIARAMLHEPDVLFLDEPTSGLDPEAAADLIGHLSSLTASSEVAVVICTHQLQGLETLCDSIGILDSGRLVASGPVTQLLEQRWPDTTVQLTVDGDPAAALAIIARAASAPPASDDGVVTLRVRSEADVPALVQALVAGGVRLTSIIPRRHTIEEYYFTTIGAER